MLFDVTVGMVEVVECEVLTAVVEAKVVVESLVECVDDETVDMVGKAVVCVVVDEAVGREVIVVAGTMVGVKVCVAVVVRDDE